jgi:hypothetical protein
VLVAAGHGEPRGAPSGKRPSHPGGLTRREVDVLRLAARGTRPARSPIGSSSLPRPPTTTSSTSTARSAYRPEPRPPCGPCTTPSSSRATPGRLLGGCGQAMDGAGPIGNPNAPTREADPKERHRVLRLPDQGVGDAD